IGSKWGRRRLAPSISPRKSLEGSLAGIIGTVLLIFLAVSTLAERIGLSPWEGLLLGLVIAVFGQLGDLVESAMKRKFEIKDAGKLIPGHGGVLDRFDSLLFAAPVVYYFVQLLAQP
ncbi:MAG: CDP-archaeol synthase, partial [Firmicutes bacterium]|nr:CDP-archaeol synthase [Bacillota bacterium]